MQRTGENLTIRGLATLANKGLCSIAETLSIVKIDRLDVPFISLEDLKINKRASGRPKGLQDFEELP